VANDIDCHQHRLISQREAARLQSFPDDFEFVGSKTSINKQIGNAVPPILAYQIAKHIDNKGIFVDLFAGAGGLSLGFKWAGWESIVANDIDGVFLQTYAKNIHPNVIVGDIRDRAVFDELIKQVTEIRKKHKGKPFYILGGPPCQGFSTAGNKRSREDERNSLFNNYKEIVEVLKPDGFVFENVMGMLSMEKGKFFQEIKESLESVIDTLSIWKISTEEYAVPQRRKRIVLIGKRGGSGPINPLRKIFDLKDAHAKFISAEEALSDLPALEQGEDGSEKDYVSEPKNDYQALMRGKISPEEFLKRIT
jgi:DNA (cytosine-5)-methyltransferase 1